MKRVLWPAAWRRHDRPTSPGVARGDLVFTSGQVGVDQRTGSLVEESAFAQTVQALRNLDEVLVDAGGSLADLVKVTVYVDDVADVAEVNRAYAEVVPEPWPARSCVRVGLARPGLRVEIEGVAILGDDRAR